MTYHIPANYTDAGRLFGLFPIRNAVEAAILAVPTLFLCFRLLPFALTTNIIITMVLVVPQADQGKARRGDNQNHGDNDVCREGKGQQPEAEEQIGRAHV